MRRGHSLALLGLAVVLSGCDPNGIFEDITTGYMTGWACDADVGGSPIQVHVWATNVNGAVNADGTPCAESPTTWCFVAGTGPGTAATYQRGSVVKQVCFDDGKHGFKIPTPTILLDGKDHLVAAHALNVGEGQNRLLGTLPFNSNVLLSQAFVRDLDEHIDVRYDGGAVARYQQSHGGTEPRQFFLHAPWQSDNYGIFNFEQLTISSFGQLLRHDLEVLDPSASNFLDPSFTLNPWTGARTASGALAAPNGVTWQRGLNFGGDNVLGFQAYDKTLGVVLAPSLKIAASDTPTGPTARLLDGAIIGHNWKTPRPPFARSKGDTIRIEGRFTHPLTENPSSGGSLFLYWTLQFVDPSTCWTGPNGQPECQAVWHAFRIFQDRFHANTAHGSSEGMGADYLASASGHAIGTIDSIIAPGSTRVRPCNGSSFFYGPSLAQASPDLGLGTGMEQVRPNEHYYCVEFDGNELEASLVQLNTWALYGQWVNFLPGTCPLYGLPHPHPPASNPGGYEHCVNRKRALDCAAGVVPCLPQIQPLPLVSTNAASYVLTHFNVNAEAWVPAAGPDPRLGFAFRDTRITLIPDSTTNLPYGYVGVTPSGLVSGWTCDFDAWGRPVDVHFWVSGVSTCLPANAGVLDGENVCLLGGVTAKDVRPDVAGVCNKTDHHGFAWQLPLDRLNPNAPPHKIHARAINYPSGANVNLLNAAHTRDPIVY